MEKKITVAVCLDDELGRTFGGRRQSRDRVLLADLLAECGEHALYAERYSETLFPGSAHVTVCDDPMAVCPDGGVCFLETLPIKPRVAQIDRLILYRWNRLYPADFYMDIDPIGAGFVLESVLEFEGSSHARITKEVYRTCK